MSDGGGKSLIVSGDALQSDTRGIELFIFVAIAIGGAWILSEILSMLIAKLVEGSGRARRYIENLNRYAGYIPRFKKRQEALYHIVDKSNESNNTLEKQWNVLSSTHRKLASASDYYLREIGSNATGTTRYTFSVSNRYVIEYVAKGQKHPLLDDSWKSGQLVEVWAKSLMDARIVMADRYPATAGYVVEMLKDKEAPPSSRK